MSTEGIQEVYTKNHGVVKVVRSFCDENCHIALCDNGAYVHITGLPVKDKAELRKAIPPEHLQAALDWFDHRHEMEENPPMRVLIEPDGTCIFEDGSPIESTSQLVQALKPGPMLDAAILAFTKKQIAKEEASAPAKSKTTKKAAPKTKAPKTAAKTAAPKPGPATVAQVTA